MYYGVNPANDFIEAVRIDLKKICKNVIGIGKS